MNLKLIPAAARPPRSLALAASLLLSQQAAAETTFVPYFDSTVTYDNNIYRVSSDSLAPLVDGKRTNADFIFTNAIGTNASYSFMQQRFYAKAEASRFSYLNIGGLDQNAYTYGGGLDWVLLGRINGNFNGSQDRTRSSFADRDVTVLNTQRTRTLGSTVNFLLANDIRVDGGYGNRLLQTPVLGAPSLRLSQNTATTAIKYIGINRLSAGLSGTYVNGNYRGTTTNTRFKQYSGGGVLEYAASDISQFALTLGYTRREDEGQSGAAAGFTGTLYFSRELTGKTAVNLNLVRAVDSFDAGDNSIITTGGNANLTWDATAKINAALGYSYNETVFQDIGSTVNVFTGRKDRTHAAKLSANYTALDWLKIAPSVGYTRRESNAAGSDYDGVVMALQFSAVWQ